MPDTKIDKRALGRLAENLTKHPPKITEQHKAEGNRLLKEATQEQEQRRLNNKKDCDNFAWDAAQTFRNRARARVGIIPSMSEKFVENYNKIDWGRK